MLKIILDPGHDDTRDNRIGTYSEAQTMLSIAKKMKALAESVDGIRVELTRTSGRPLDQNYAEDLRQRGRKSRGSALFLSLHSDAHPNPATRGNTLYGNIRPDKADPAFFKELSDAVARATGFPGKGQRYREDSDPARYIVHPKPVAGKENYYAVLRHAEADRSCLLELGFHTHEKERNRLADPRVQEQIARHLMDVIARRYGSGKKAVDPSAFLDQILPEVLISARKNNLLPSIILAQGMLESGHGTSELARQGKNLFGIKASPPWNGDTLLYKGEKYRKYADFSASIRDHGAFFTSTPHRRDRYAKLIGEKDAEKAVLALGASGYAGDPEYGRKIARVIRDYGLTRYDEILQQENNCPCDWSISLLKRIGNHREVKK